MEIFPAFELKTFLSETKNFHWLWAIIFDLFLLLTIFMIDI